MSLVDVADRDASAPVHHDTPPPNDGLSLAQPPPANDPPPAEEMEVSPPPESHPMTATASNSSLNPSQENGEGAAAMYGTRSSRQRPGARPNYADDKELDMEIEAAGRISKPGSKKHRSNLSSTETTLRSENNSPAPRNGFAAINATASAANGNPTTNKDVIPGTSSFSAHPTAPVPSKKRKQPGSSNTVTNQVNNHSATKPRNNGNMSRTQPETNMMSFSHCGSRLNNKKQLVADDGTVLSANDHAYFICEPPGEPYYLARIMEFLPARTDEPDSSVDSVRVNWYYRPKDIQRRAQDTRVVYASMHSDTCPLTSLRGKCQIQHASDIPSLDHYRTQKDSFWFDKLYDRYMHKYYDVIPTSKVINVPQHVKKVLDERWKFVLVELGRGRELTSAVKTCKKCSQYAASHDSVDCAVCKNTYHMACIRPPLLKKPARGFAWACAACSRAQEMRLEARNTPTLTDSGLNRNDEPQEEEEENTAGRGQMTRESSLAPEPHPPPTAAQLAQANLWPYRYLGIHCRVEDALDYDDRIYPRASSRLGPRHQANVTVWHGRPVEMVKPADLKRKYVKNVGQKKDTKLAKETQAALEAEKENKLKRPKWVVDEPFGYVARGEDTPIEIKGKQEYTAQLIFKMPEPSKFSTRGGDDSDDIVPEDREKLVDEYMANVEHLAGQYNVKTYSTDFLTKAVEKLQENNYDSEKALDAMKELSVRTDLKQPDLNREEVKRFEEGVAKYGSELHNVARHVSPTIKEGRIVRFYYMWKKTEKGRQIWGNFEGRKSKKESKRLEKDGTGTGTKLLDDVADNQDDSAFDNDKASEKKRGFECKFCFTRKSRQWRRAPGTAPGTLVPTDASAKGSKDKTNWLTLALCGKCAYLWRRYAIMYESIEEVSKKIAAAGGRASKRKIDEELMRTIVEAQGETGDQISANTAAVAASAGVEIPASIIEAQEPLKKKAKAEQLPNGTAEPLVEKKKAEPKPPPEPEPLVPEMPRVKIHHCAVCHVENLPGDELLKCRDCRLHVHKSCYGIPPENNARPWYCDMCHNDHNMLVSTIYECCLCPVKYTAQELMEPLKVSHKKKTDREREKERLEREMVQEAGRRWRQEQEQAGRPVNPREALKRTAWNNWVHVICAIWTEEMKFGNAELFDEAEGVGFIPLEKFRTPCVICKEIGKPVVNCFVKDCPAQFHVGCAHQADYFFGFEIFLPKGTRREAKPMMQLDRERGHARPVIWCQHHPPLDTYIHSMLEATDENITALQLYARLYKQVDKSVTATARRAAQFTSNMLTPSSSTGSATRQNTISNGTDAAPSPISAGELRAEPEAIGQDTKLPENDQSRKKCCTCSVRHSPWWWTVQRPAPTARAELPVVNGVEANRDDQNVEPSRDATATDTTQRSTTSPSLTSNATATELNIRSDTHLTNGVVKTEEPADVNMADAPAITAEDELDQCHKCHKKRLLPPSSPPRPPQAASAPSMEQPQSVPEFYQAQPHQPAGYQAWRPAPLETQLHSHPGPPPPQLHWQNPPPNPPYPGHSSWATHARNGVPPPTPGSTYHQGPPPGSHEHYGHHAYSVPYTNGYPPAQPRAQPNGASSHHSPTPSYGYPELGHGPPPLPPNQSQYPQSPRAYGSLLSDRQTFTSPRVHHNGPPPLPRGYAQPSPLETQGPPHSRAQSLHSPQQGYSTAPPPPLPSYRQAQPPLPPPHSAGQGPSVQSLSLIAQSAAAQMDRGFSMGHGHDHVQGLGLRSDFPQDQVARRGSVESSMGRPRTPAERNVENERDGGVDTGLSGRGLPGASASPGLKNLLN